MAKKLSINQAFHFVESGGILPWEIWIDFLKQFLVKDVVRDENCYERNFEKTLV